jgi:hypothetical protein
MERREERLEKCREPIGFRFESGRGAMQTRAPPICLFELVAKKSIACERAINQVTLRVLQFPCGNELFAVNREFGTHPIRRQRGGWAVNENKTGDLPVEKILNVPSGRNRPVKSCGKRNARCDSGS